MDASLSDGPEKLAMNDQKTRIAIVGLKGNQQQKIEMHCSALSRLSFVDGRRPPKELPEVDHVILMPALITKRWTQSALRRYDKSRVHLHWGGVSTLVERIGEICA